MSDIFREVEEDIRKERLERLWKAYGDYVIAFLAVAIIGIAGFELWQRYEDSQRAKASTALIAAQQVNTPAGAEAAFIALSKNAPSGYAELARLGQAHTLGASGKVADAVALYKDIAQADSGPVGATARLRAAWLLADTAPRTELTGLLDPISATSSAWRQMAQEVLAYSDFKSGKLADATAEFDALGADAQAPDALKNRARAFAAFLHAGGAANFGSVPPPAPAPAPGTPPGATP